MEHSMYATTDTQFMVPLDLAIKPRTLQPKPLAQARDERELHNGPMGHSMAGRTRMELRRQ